MYYIIKESAAKQMISMGIKKIIDVLMMKIMPDPNMQYLFVGAKIALKKESEGEMI